MIKVENIEEILFERKLIFLKEEKKNELTIYFGKPFQVKNDYIWYCPFELKEDSKRVFINRGFQIDPLDSLISAMRLATDLICFEAKNRNAIPIWEHNIDGNLCLVAKDRNIIFGSSSPISPLTTELITFFKDLEKIYFRADKELEPHTRNHDFIEELTQFYTRWANDPLVKNTLK